MGSANIPSYRLDGKVALITGSSRGMGRQNALELAARGADLVINYQNREDAANAVVKEIKCLGRDAIAVQGDVSSLDDVVAMFEKAVSHFGHIDIVVSNSGIEHFGHISKLTVEEIDRVFATNTRGQLLVAQQAYKHLTEGGTLILNSSAAADAKMVYNHSVYAGSKAAVQAFARCLALDFGSRKITVNAIAPAGIKTDMYHDVARQYYQGGEKFTDAEVDEAELELTPLKRVGVPEDVSRVVAFLASDDARWINGQTVHIDGAAAK